MNIGIELKNARESRKISLEAISKRTRIAVKYLEALEGNQYDIFPSHTYVKGFIRAYAKLVGLDPVQLTRQFNAEVQPQEMRIEPKNAEADFERSRGWLSPRERPAVIQRPMDEEEPSEAAAREEEPPAPSPLVRRRFFALRRRALARGAVRALYAVLVLAACTTLVYYGTRLLSKVNGSSPKPAVETAEPQSFEAVTVTDKYQHLILKGLDHSWVMVTMDGQSTSQVDLDQGETKAYKALKSFNVKVGNAGGVQIQFNGKPLGVLGTEGQVVEIQLPPGTDNSVETSPDSDGNS